MRYLFYPAIALMQRVGYTRKFILMGAVTSIAFLLIATSLFIHLNSEISRSQRELEGIVLATPISRTIQLLQQHRGLSTAVLSSHESLREARAAKGQEIIEAFAALEGRLPPNLASSEDWQRIRKSWEDLQMAGLGWDVARNFNAHSQVIDRMLMFKVVVSGEYVLPLDPQIDTSYLIDVAINRLPMALEHLGQVRARGLDSLGKKALSDPQQLALKTLIEEFNTEAKFIGIDFNRISRHNPDLRERLSAVADNISVSARQITGLVESDIFTRRFGASPEDFYLKASTVIDSGYLQLHGLLLPMIETLIRERIAHASKVLRNSIGTAFLLLLIVAYFAIGTYYAVAGSIRSLSRSARAFAAGNMNQRVDLGTRDELKEIGDSFNEMADSFRSLLEARQHAESLARKAAEETEDLYNHAPCGYHSVGADGTILRMNDTELGWLGYTREEVIGKLKWENLLAPEGAQFFRENFLKFKKSGMLRDVEAEVVRRDGTTFTGLINASAVYDADGNFLMSRSTVLDITERKLAENRMLHMAHYDGLTGLPNRTLFYDRLAQEIKKAHRGGLKMALLFIDLDRFKEVNDTLGHNKGDMLLVEAAQRIGYCVRETDTVARLGGDEFTVILSELEINGSVDRVADDILHKLAEPFRLEDEVVYVSASIGITLYPDDATGVEELLKDADQAMYVAKSGGRNRFDYFTRSMQQTAQARLRLLGDLRGALTAGQFRAYYQPIVELATGRLCKAEALIRWEHPKRGTISPAEFIPLAEETGLITAIGDWMFREAARQTARWRVLYDPGFQISVNKSPVQFHDAESPSRLWPDYLRELGLPGQSMVIEITENLLLEAESGVKNKLMQISLDDFGTAYSSLSYLRKFDIDYLKIDKSFIHDLAPGSSSMALSEAIIVMAHKLGLLVVAEGVETETQRKLLADAGCDYAQGYLFSKPVPAEEFERLYNHGLPLAGAPSAGACPHASHGQEEVGNA
ncbi:MAG: diguanylate cyclase/phosphodiesterase [Gallionellaceae bacterium]|nr:MAG: diguanylate cyclase/phosphodiesterase [Gallionellaceae bacterium]